MVAIYNAVQKLKVLIADDSTVSRQLLTGVINSSADMQVVGEASSGRQAVKLACDLRPHVIVMDLTMPEMGGLEATREIMYLSPTPIVMVSASVNTRETDIAFEAINAGALTVMPKPVGPLHPHYHDEAAALLSTLRAMADVQVIHRWRRPDLPKSGALARTDVEIPRTITPPQLIAIVSSTGGPAALNDIIHALPGDYPLPIVVVQHIAVDFQPSLVEWLGSGTTLRVVTSSVGEQPQPGSVYIAPGDAHLLLTRERRFRLDRTPGRSRYMASGDILLESVARTYGAHAAGVVLTGMGSDGAIGLRQMYEASAFTIAQDEATSVVYGMPREAVTVGAVRQVLPLPEIASALLDLARLGVTRNE
jgi:two-component system, chemotaxis family, protein-glutamate methylesterase/glutaminase